MGKAVASNEALSLATGDLVAFLDPDDELRRDALYEVVRFLNQNPDFDLVYTDEDHIDEAEVRSDPFFKPDWSPELLMSYNYVSNFSVYRRSMIEQIGGFREGFYGSQDYDLALRFSEKANEIGHIPKVLYSKRKARESRLLNSTPCANEAAIRALREAAARRGFEAEITEIRAGGPFRVRYALVGDPLVSIIIPTRSASLTESCLQSLTRSGYHNLEVLVLDSSNGNEVKNVAAKFRNCRVLRFDGSTHFNFAKVNNRGATVAGGEYLIFLNDDTEVIDPGWVEAMLEHAQRPGVGAVGAKLLYPNGSVQHAGIIVGFRGPAEHYAGIHADDPGYYNLAEVVRNCSAVTGACMMVKRQLFMDEGMFDEALGRSWQDVDFCLRLKDAGYRTVYTPFACLIHRHGATRAVSGHTDKSRDEDAARERFRSRWHSLIEHGDKYYSPNLSKRRPYEVEWQEIILNLGADDRTSETLTQ
jgi:GT2 family glycosyltransferase